MKHFPMAAMALMILWFASVCVLSFMSLEGGRFKSELKACRAQVEFLRSLASVEPAEGKPCKVTNRYALYDTQTGRVFMCAGDWRTFDAGTGGRKK